MAFKKIMTGAVLLGAICVFVMLGNWQLQRLAWKQAMLADIEAQAAIDITETRLDLTQAADFQRGYILGTYLNKPPVKIGPRTHEGKSGYHILQPFRTVQGQNIMINRGWVGATDDAPITAPLRNLMIGGYLKSPDHPSAFTPKNQPDQGLWYSADIKGFEAFYDIPLQDHILYQEVMESDRPQTFTGLPALKNNHLAYAIFWFGMAGLLVILVGIRMFSKNR